MHFYDLAFLFSNHLNKGLKRFTGGSHLILNCKFNSKCSSKDQVFFVVALLFNNLKFPVAINQHKSNKKRTCKRKREPATIDAFQRKTFFCHKKTQNNNLNYLALWIKCTQGKKGWKRLTFLLLFANFDWRVFVFELEKNGFLTPHKKTSNIDWHNFRRMTFDLIKFKLFHICDLNCALFYIDLRKGCRFFWESVAFRYFVVVWRQSHKFMILWKKVFSGRIWKQNV